MRLLPCLRIGADRWWLPLSAESSEILASVMLSDPVASSGGALDESEDAVAEVDRFVGRSVSDRGLAKLQSQLGRDPSLLIYSALAMGASGDFQVSLRQLARWLARNAVGRFASGEAYLGAPAVTQEVKERWVQLTDFFRTLPRRQWLDEAPLWLELLGPPVPESWRRTWPKLSDDDASLMEADELTVEEDAESESVSVLQRLARRQLRHRSLEQSFSKRLNKNKLASLKQFAYGLSHEINNPLANISTRAQQLQRSEPDSARNATLQRIIDQVYRAHAMIADLMFYANPPEVHAQVTDLVDVIRDVVNEFDDEAERQTIRLETELPDRSVKVRLDPVMIGEAVRVLIRNAIEAIGCQGTVVVSMLVEPNGWKPRVGESSPSRIVMHIADSGPGVSKEARQHAFDPYFSGREAGRGLGVGLCRAYRVVQLHRGTIELAGGPAGCVATMTLPLRRN